MSSDDTWTTAELHDQLDRFEAMLRSAGPAENTIRTYVDRSRDFVRWLNGDYSPGAGPA